jgi:hypothetical protein
MVVNLSVESVIYPIFCRVLIYSFVAIVCDTFDSRVPHVAHGHFAAIAYKYAPDQVYDFVGSTHPNEIYASPSSRDLVKRSYYRARSCEKRAVITGAI